MAAYRTRHCVEGLQSHWLENLTSIKFCMTKCNKNIQSCYWQVELERLKDLLNFLTKINRCDLANVCCQVAIYITKFMYKYCCLILYKWLCSLSSAAMLIINIKQQNTPALLCCIPIKKTSTCHICWLELPCIAHSGKHYSSPSNSPGVDAANNNWNSGVLYSFFCSPIKYNVSLHWKEYKAITCLMYTNK